MTDLWVLLLLLLHLHGAAPHRVPDVWNRAAVVLVKEKSGSHVSKHLCVASRHAAAKHPLEHPIVVVASGASSHALLKCKGRLQAPLYAIGR